MPVFEIIVFQASDDFLKDHDTLKPVFSRVSQAKGMIEARYGFTNEDPKTCYLLIKWETIAHHTAITEEPDFPELREMMGKLVSGVPQMFHVEFENDSSPALDAPITEISLFNLKEGKSKADLKDVFAKHFGPDSAIASVQGAVPGSAAWNATEENANKCFLVVGWESLKHHKESAGREEFKEPFAQLMAISDIEVVHTHFTKLEKV